MTVKKEISTKLPKIIQQTIQVAEIWYKESLNLQKDEEKKFQEKMKHVSFSPQNYLALLQLIDQMFRSSNPKRIIEQFLYILEQNGVPAFFSESDRLLSKMFMKVGKYIPGFSEPKVAKKILQDTKHFIFNDQSQELVEFLNQQYQENKIVDVAYYFEPALGQKESEKNFQKYLYLLEHPKIPRISINISALVPQLYLSHYGSGQDLLEGQLFELLEASQKYFYTTPQGKKLPKQICIDINDYLELSFVSRILKDILFSDELLSCSVGITLPSYIPDSFLLQQELTAWSQERVLEGGEPIFLRLVKGAWKNYEKFNAAVKSWVSPIFEDKEEVDANLKKMIDFGLLPENINVVKIIVGSHNVFDLAYAYSIAKNNQVLDNFYIETFKGVVSFLTRKIQECFSNTICYTPIFEQDNFSAVVPYLLSRINENAKKHYFVHSSLNMEVQSHEWNSLIENFVHTWEKREQIDYYPKRMQDRGRERIPKGIGTFYTGIFRNEPLTDWSLEGNQLWAKKIRKKWEMLDDASLKAIPLQLGGQFLADQRDVQPCYDISCVPKYEYSSFVLGTIEDAKSAIEMLHQDHQQWRGKALRSQHQIFSKIALKLREKRNDIIASFLMGASFSYIEADSELNRIIDFLEFYPQSLYFYKDFSQLISEGRGVAFITSSTPQLISEVIGGVVAGLIAGNSIICALSGEIFFPYWNLFQVFYENGVSPETLILFPCSSETLQSIIQNPVADIILSFGSKERFLEITQNNPEIPVLGHYQEKALMVVSAMADHQQAIRHIIESFAILSNQKQGALSLLILEEEVYYKKLLQNKVIDSIQSVGLGSVWDFSTIATPILNFDEKELILKDGETWLLKPKQDPSNEHLWSLGVKLVQQPTLQISDNHLPVLELKLVDDFQEAIELTKQLSQYSIACLESLDPKEIQQWKNEVQVGSVYINEKTTESFTARQPFGGIGKGRKIGGDNYLLPLMVHHEVGLAKKQKVKEDYAVLEKLNFWVEKIQSNEKFADFFQRDLEQITLAASNYLHWWESYFEQNHDYYRIRGQDNIVRYHSIGTVVICVHEDDTLFEVFARIIAAHIADCEIIISYSNNADSYVTQFLDLHVGYLREDFFVLKQNSAELLELMSKAKVLRYAHPDRVPAEIYEAAAQTGFYLCVEPPLMEGRLELLHYLKEQTVTYSYHRFGNLEQRTLMS